MNAMNDDDDADLREAFRTLKEHDRAHAPSFARTRARADTASRARARTRVVGAFATVGAVVLAFVALAVLRPQPETSPEPARWAVLPAAAEPLGFLARPPTAPVTSSERLLELERSW